MSLFRNHRRAALIGLVFGALAPFAGLFFGLQVSPLLGNILAFPLIVVSWLAGEPIGSLPVFLLAVGFLLSSVIWCLLFVGLAVLGRPRAPS